MTLPPVETAPLVERPLLSGPEPAGPATFFTETAASDRPSTSQAAQRHAVAPLSLPLGFPTAPPPTHELPDRADAGVLGELSGGGDELDPMQTDTMASLNAARMVRRRPLGECTPSARVVFGGSAMGRIGLWWRLMLMPAGAPSVIVI